MKLFIRLLVSFLAVTCAFATSEPVSPEKAAKLAVQNKCIEEAGTTLEHVVGARDGKYGDEDKLENYLNCVFKKFGFLDEEGNVSAEGLKSKIPAGVSSAKAGEAIDDCIQKTKDVSTHKVLALYKCYVEKRVFRFL